MRHLRLKKLLQEKMDANQKLAGMKKGKEAKEEHVKRLVFHHYFCSFLFEIGLNSLDEVGK